MTDSVCVILDPQSEIWKKIQMAKQKFRLISGFAELTRETKITAEMRLVANISGWNTAEPHFLVQKVIKICYLIYDYKDFFYEAEQWV